MMVRLRYEHILSRVDPKSFFRTTLRSTGGLAESGEVVHLHLRAFKNVPDSESGWPNILRNMSARVTHSQVLALAYLHFFKSVDALQQADRGLCISRLAIDCPVQSVRHIERYSR